MKEYKPSFFRKELAPNTNELTDELFRLDHKIEGANDETKEGLKKEILLKLSEALSTLTTDDFVPEPEAMVGQEGSYNNNNTRVFACYFSDRTALMIERNRIPATAQSQYVQDLNPDNTKPGIGALEYRAFFRLPVKTYVHEKRHLGKVEIPTAEKLHDDGKFHVAGSTGYSFAIYDDGEIMRGDYNERLQSLADAMYEKYKTKYAYGTVDTRKEIYIDGDQVSKE